LRFDPNGEGAVIAGPFGFANGLAISAGDRTIYVVESDKDRILAIDTATGETHVRASNTGRMPDGLAISRVISTLLAHAWDEILLDDTAPKEEPAPAQTKSAAPQTDAAPSFSLAFAQPCGWVALATSMRTPGPMDELIATFFRKVPFAPVGLAFTTASTNVRILVMSANRPRVVMPSHAPSALRSRPASTLLCGHQCMNCVGRSKCSSRFAASKSGVSDSGFH